MYWLFRLFPVSYLEMCLNSPGLLVSLLVDILLKRERRHYPLYSIYLLFMHITEKEFMGKTIEVKQAKNNQRPVIIAAGSGGSGQNMMNNNANQAASLAAAAIAAAASGNTMSSLMNNSAAAAASLAALTGCGGGGGGMGGGPYGDKLDMGMYGGGMGGGRDGRNMGNMSGRPGPNGPPAGGRAGDWICPVCNNIGFSWRDRCKQCNVRLIVCDIIKGVIIMTS